ncbi:MAG: hypothetical protein RMJ87_06605 [Cytophagales bacterium]|nr:hypothetical protein [Bernardetiaceae bacterium]MDW8204682.1 hypothetical protein [Cytophagales bacterium]
MREKLRHIFCLLLAVQVVVASTGATFYKHYCHIEGELLAVSAFQPEEPHCANHHRETHSHQHEPTACNDDCCDLHYEFYRSEIAPLTEGIKLFAPAAIVALPIEHLFWLLPASLRCAVVQPIFYFSHSLLHHLSGKALLPFIQQFRL